MKRNIHATAPITRIRHISRIVFEMSKGQNKCFIFQLRSDQRLAKKYGYFLLQNIICLILELHHCKGCHQNVMINSTSE